MSGRCEGFCTTTNYVARQICLRLSRVAGGAGTADTWPAYPHLPRIFVDFFRNARCPVPSLHVSEVTLPTTRGLCLGV
jgi:hypothetical protein